MVQSHPCICPPLITSEIIIFMKLGMNIISLETINNNKVVVMQIYDYGMTISIGYRNLVS
jgi:hypothetical protein